MKKTQLKWFRRVNPVNGYYYDFQSENMEAALKYAAWKFYGGVIGELID